MADESAKGEGEGEVRQRREPTTTHGLHNLRKYVWRVGTGYVWERYGSILPPMVGPVGVAPLNPKQGTIGVARRRYDKDIQHPKSYARAHSNKLKKRPDPFYAERYLANRIKLKLMSFGHKFGEVPYELGLDKYFDVRHMLHPDIKLKKKALHGHAQSGLDHRIQQNLMAKERNREIYQEIVENIQGLIVKAIKKGEYPVEIRVAIGCHSGRNRGPAVVSMLAQEDWLSFLNLQPLDEEYNIIEGEYKQEDEDFEENEGKEKEKEEEEEEEKEEEEEEENEEEEHEVKKKKPKLSKRRRKNKKIREELEKQEQELLARMAKREEEERAREIARMLAKQKEKEEKEKAEKEAKEGKENEKEKEKEKEKETFSDFAFWRIPVDCIDLDDEELLNSEQPIAKETEPEKKDDKKTPEPINFVPPELIWPNVKDEEEDEEFELIIEGDLEVMVDVYHKDFNRRDKPRDKKHWRYRQF